MTQDNGASLRDRAGGPSDLSRSTASQPEALIPSANVRVTTRREVIQDVPARFEKQYGRDRDGYSWRGNVSLGDMIDALNALDTSTCSANEINAIIGNSSWTELDCDICDRRDCEVVAEIGEEPNYEARWLNICPSCLVRLGEWAASGMSAFGQDPQGLEAQPASPTGEAGDAHPTPQSDSQPSGASHD